MNKKVSIVIPVYNEEKTIKKLLAKVNSVDLSSLGIKKEIIVVNDGSKDNTLTILKKNKKLYTKLISKPNGGKGSALRIGFEAANGDIILMQDADLEYNPNDYVTLLLPILQGKTEVVYGSRFKSTEITSPQRWALPTHYLGNKLLSLITSIFFFKYITDMETGYKCFTQNVLKKIKLTENDFTIEPEITTQILKQGFDILEVPIHYYARGFEEGKKITWKHGITAVLCIIKQRFTR